MLNTTIPTETLCSSGHCLEAVSARQLVVPAQGSESDFSGYTSGNAAAALKETKNWAFGI